MYPLPQIFKGQRELTGSRQNQDTFQGMGPSFGVNTFQGALSFTYPSGYSTPPFFPLSILTIISPSLPYCSFCFSLFPPILHKLISSSFLQLSKKWKW